MVIFPAVFSRFDQSLIIFLEYFDVNMNIKRPGNNGKKKVINNSYDNRECK